MTGALCRGMFHNIALTISFALTSAIAIAIAIDKPFTNKWFCAAQKQLFPYCFEGCAQNQLFKADLEGCAQNYLF